MIGQLNIIIKTLILFFFTTFSGASIAADCRDLFEARREENLSKIPIERPDLTDLKNKRILYLNSWTNEDRNVRTYLPEIASNLVILCPDGRAEVFRSEGLEALDINDLSPSGLEALCEGPLKGMHFEKIFADAEDHMIPAAWLREYLNVPGQTKASAQAFRDKHSMMSYLTGKLNHFRLASGLKGPGSVFVVKPIMGTDSESILTLERSEAESYKINPGVLIQEFIPHPVFHVDGLFQHGKILFHSVTKYIGTCLAYRTGAAVGGVIQLDEKIRTRFLKATQELMKRMPSATEMIFHAEFFYDQDTDDMVFCEVAGRSGGGCGIIVRSIFDTYGIHLTRELILMQTLPNYNFVLPPKRQDHLVASYLMIPNPGGAQVNFDQLKEIEVTYILEGNRTRESDFSSHDGLKLVWLDTVENREKHLKQICENVFAN